MDHKREICCLNNDYLLYLANMKRGKYNSFVTQRENVNGWKLESEFTLRKFTDVSWVTNYMTHSQGWTVKRCPYQPTFHQRKSLLWAGLPRGEHWDGVWGARYASGVVCCGWKGKLQDWAEKEAKLPGRPHETQVALPLGLPPVAPALSPDVGGLHVGLLSAAIRHCILWTWRLFWPHSLDVAVSPCVLEGSSGWRICLCRSFSPMNIRDFLQFYPYGIYNSQYTSPLIRQVFTFFRHIDDKSPFNILIWFKCFLNYVGCICL